MTDTFDLAGKRVWVAGHRGMVGQALARRLAREKCEVVTVDRAQLDQRRQRAVEEFLEIAKPDVIFMAAATVGGIMANHRRPADFLYDNLAIETNIIHAAHVARVDKLVMLGSSCIYPRMAPQPIPESSMLTGPLEPTNQWYAIAKIAGVMLCDAYRRQHGSDFVSAMPPNLYGPGDNFDLESSHMVPALIRKMHEAKLAHRPAVELWGTGEPFREAMYVDDAADAIVFIARNYSAAGPINIGMGTDHRVRDIAERIARVTGFTGGFIYDSSKPDGTPRKLVDNARLTKLGWHPRIGLDEGLKRTYAWYLENVAQAA